MKKIAFAVAVFGLAAPAIAQEENAVEMGKVPEVVKTMAMQHAMGATLDKVQMDDGVYELSGKMANGMQVEVDVKEDGTLEEVEEQIAMDALPQPVTAALTKELAGFTPTMIEKSTRADGAVVYEFEGTHEGKEIDAEINADGSGFSKNDDAAG